MQRGWTNTLILSLKAEKLKTKSREKVIQKIKTILMMEKEEFYVKDPLMSIFLSSISTAMKIQFLKNTTVSLQRA